MRLSVSPFALAVRPREVPRMIRSVLPVERSFTSSVTVCSPAQMQTTFAGQRESPNSTARTLQRCPVFGSRMIFSSPTNHTSVLPRSMVTGSLMDGVGVVGVPVVVGVTTSGVSPSGGTMFPSVDVVFCGEVAGALERRGQTTRNVAAPRRSAKRTISAILIGVELFDGCGSTDGS